ncbi:hypothetical protein [Marinomonas mediterranea]|jgi:hypothetical protein|uniref:Transmembrane protein n=1 Tax=Marinomonas mediterranea (strain ATCC 700492 / JCM 21426 / NBRC 103028 / MMB-1) TaxID=717774 RepID=F2JZS1_MARM1|nr:hypothetical protein [Marinomonas mediterranea]ADZ90925.1 hypothetical protein Marme_1664 [Marinomonas mediterranea MMB-1]WCN17068.1 hypothetical protein GV053_08430 [Marinomonas mediterranea MMB-1]
MSIFTAILVLLLTPLLVWLGNQFILKEKFKSIGVSLLSALLVYLFIVGSAAYYDYKYEAELAAFDLNQDGMFSGDEVTLEQEKAMLRVISDTGRTFAPFTGAIFSILYFSCLWITFVLSSKVYNRTEPRNT